MEVELCQNFMLMKQNCLMKFRQDVLYQRNLGAKDKNLLTSKLEFRRRKLADLHASEVPCIIINVKIEKDD